MFAVNQTSIDDSIHINSIMSLFTRYSLVLLNIAILIMGFGGNAIVLYGSIVHNALRMDRITLLLVRNVAVADMIVSILFYLPAFINLLHGRWALGYGLCWINGWLSLVPTVCEILTLTLLSCYRLALILGRVSRSARHTMGPWYGIVALLWGAILILPLFFTALSFIPYYDPYTQSCNSADMSSADEPIHKVVLIAMLNVVLILIPMFLITTTNVIILHIIYRAAWNFNRQSVRTQDQLPVPGGPVQPPSSKTRPSMPSRTIKAIPIICLTFVFSYFPYIIACMSNLGVTLPAWWRTLAFYSTALNTVSNPMIYMAVNLDFRRYILTNMLGFSSSSNNTVIANKAEGSSSVKSAIYSGNSATKTPLAKQSMSATTTT